MGECWSEFVICTKYYVANFLGRPFARWLRLQGFDNLHILLHYVQFQSLSRRAQPYVFQVIDYILHRGPSLQWRFIVNHLNFTPFFSYNYEPRVKRAYVILCAMAVIA